MEVEEVDGIDGKESEVEEEEVVFVKFVVGGVVVDDVVVVKGNGVIRSGAASERTWLGWNGSEDLFASNRFTSLISYMNFKINQREKKM